MKNERDWFIRRLEREPELERELMNDHDLFTVYQSARVWNYVAYTLKRTMLDSETYDLWLVATLTCRERIKELEKQLAFQVRGRIDDAKERNQVIQKLKEPKP